MDVIRPKEFKYFDLTKNIIGIFYAVYNELGYGFLESVYEEAMTIGLRDAGLKVERQVPLPVWFRNQKIGDFRADILVEEAVLLELKCARVFEPVHEAQLLNYLKATTIEIGLLFNFGPFPQFRRLAFANERKKIRVNLRESAAKVSA